MISPPATRAIGRFLFAFLSSEFTDVAIIHPSYAKAVATIEANRGLLVAVSARSIPVVVIFSISTPFSETRPHIMPTTAIRIRGTSLITVVVTWKYPASLGEIALTKYAAHIKNTVIAIHSGPITQPPSSAGIIIGNCGHADVINTRVNLADSHASTEVSVG